MVTHPPRGRSAPCHGGQPGLKSHDERGSSHPDRRGSGALPPVRRGLCHRPHPRRDLAGAGGRRTVPAAPRGCGGHRHAPAAGAGGARGRRHGRALRFRAGVAAPAVRAAPRSLLGRVRGGGGPASGRGGAAAHAGAGAGGPAPAHPAGGESPGGRDGYGGVLRLPRPGPAGAGRRTGRPGPGLVRCARAPVAQRAEGTRPRGAAGPAAPPLQLHE